MNEVTLPELQDYFSMVPKEEREAALRWITVNRGHNPDYSWVRKNGLGKQIKVVRP